MLNMRQSKTKLNALQNRTLALFQELAKSEETSFRVEGTDDISIMYIALPHGNHAHIGNFVVSAREASGFNNESVWKALERKGLARSEYPHRLILTRQSLCYETGFADTFNVSDH